MGQDLSQLTWLSYDREDEVPRGEFEKFSDLPYDLRLLIWKDALPGPRIVEVRETLDEDGKQCWVSASHPPTITRVCRESRAIAARHYSFAHKPQMGVFLDTEVDTLYFGPSENEWTLLEFLTQAKPQHVKRLKNLAINEMYLAVWSKSQSPRSELKANSETLPPLSSVLMGLDRLMIGVQVENDQNPRQPIQQFDDWPGWLFGGGPPTTEERSILMGANAELIFSAHTIDGLIFHIWTHKPGQSPNHTSYAGSLSLTEVFDGQRLHKLFKHYYPPETETLSRNTSLNHYRTSRPDDVSTWCRKIYWRIAKADFRVKRMFAKHQRENADWKEGWIPPRVACFSRPAGSFLSWGTCLQPLCDIQWSSVQDLSRFEIEAQQRRN